MLAVHAVIAVQLGLFYLLLLWSVLASVVLCKLSSSGPTTPRTTNTPLPTRDSSLRLKIPSSGSE